MGLSVYSGQTAPAVSLEHWTLLAAWSFLSTSRRYHLWPRLAKPPLLKPEIQKYSAPAQSHARLPETRTATAHDLALADKLSAELGTVKSQVDIEVDTVKCALGCVHPLKVLLQVLAR